MHRRWLVIRNGAVGDTVLLSPLIGVIRRAEPQAEITVMGVAERVALLVGEGMADRAVSFEQPGIESLYAEAGEIAESVQAFLTEYDVILYMGSGDLKRMAERLRVRPDQIVSAHPALPQAGEPVHVVDHSLKALEGLVAIGQPPRPCIPLGRDEKEDARLELVKRCGGTLEDVFLLGLHVGASSAAKRAPLDYFFRIVERINEVGRMVILLPQGPADEDAVQDFLNVMLNQKQVVLIRNEPLRRVAALLSACDIFVGNDSGITHVAAAVGCPVLVFFVREDPWQWAPRCEHARIVDLREVGGEKQTGNLEK